MIVEGILVDNNQINDGPIDPMDDLLNICSRMTMRKPDSSFASLVLG